jgi:hypothetical protein
MEDFKMTDDTPALYYAEAAWAVQHGNAKQAKNWIANAGNLFSPELNRSFAAPLNDLGWITPAKTPAQPTPSAVVAEALSTPRPLPSPEPVTKAEAPRGTPATTPGSIAAEEEPESTEAAPSPTPKVVKTKNRIARREKAAPRKKESETLSSRKHTAHKKRRDTDEIEIRRAKPVLRARAGPPAPGIVAIPEPPAPENLGDKVRNFFLYPFRPHNEEPTKPSAAGSKTRPTPTPLDRQRN